MSNARSVGISVLVQVLSAVYQNDKEIMDTGHNDCAGEKVSNQDSWARLVIDVRKAQWHPLQGPLRLCKGDLEKNVQAEMRNAVSCAKVIPV